MKATILGAISLLFFLFHLQLLSSSGWMAQNTGKSSRVSCRWILMITTVTVMSDANEPERQGPQVEQEVGQGKKGIDDQSDPANWTKKRSTLQHKFDSCTLEVLQVLSQCTGMKSAPHFYPSSIFKTNCPLSTFKATRMVYFRPISR